MQYEILQASHDVLKLSRELILPLHIKQDQW